MDKVSGIAQRLGHGSTSRADAAQLIAGLSAAELKQVAKAFDIHAVGNKQQIARRIVEGTAGARADSAAIRDRTWLG